MWGLGVDIGKHADPCAIMGVLRTPKVIDPNLPGVGALDAGYLKRPKKIIQEYQVRLIERPPLMTKYEYIRTRVDELMHSRQMLEESRLIVDIGEVGDALFEDWRDRYRLNPIGIRLIGGNTTSRSEEGWNVSKQRLISPLMNVFSTGRIRFVPMTKAMIKASPTARIRELRQEYYQLKEITAKELNNFRIKKITPKGPQMEGRQGEHDDLVLALALVVWYFEHVSHLQFEEGVEQQARKIKDTRKQWNPLWDDEDEFPE